MTNTEFEEVFITYFPSLCDYASRLVEDDQIAKDLVQDVFVRLIVLKTNKIESLRAYLFASTRNACTAYLKQHKRQVALDDNYIGEITGEESAFQLEMIRAEVIRQLTLALNQLPTQCRKIIRMAYVDQLPGKLIAAQLGISVSTVNNQKARGLVLLRKIMGKSRFLLMVSLFY